MPTTRERVYDYFASRLPENVGVTVKHGREYDVVTITVTFPVPGGPPVTFTRRMGVQAYVDLDRSCAYNLDVIKARYMTYLWSEDRRVD